MPLCGKIKQGFLYNCENPPIGGTEARMYVFNREDIAAITRDITNPQIITGFTLVADAVGFVYEGFNTSVKPKVEFVRKEYASRYNHLIDFLIFTRGSAAKEEIEALGTGRYIVVIENLQKTGDVAFEVYGTDVGLELKSMTGDPNDQNNEGAYVLQLGSPENYKEPHMPATFYMTSYAATKALLTTLVTPEEEG